ncbi:MAG: hypothetical protein HY282_13290 [Nitrospirae bacterium]|nr:hypothetical protein [Candidatus Manganitrophaceae bacterium]
MKRMIIWFGGVFLLFNLLFLRPAGAEGVALGIITGGQYLKDTESDRIAYLIGVIDGISIEAFKAANKAQTPWLATCLENLEIAEVKTLFEKRLNAGAETLRAPAALTFRNVMEAFCQNRNKDSAK